MSYGLMGPRQNFTNYKNIAAYHPENMAHAHSEDWWWQHHDMWRLIFSQEIRTRLLYDFFFLVFFPKTSQVLISLFILVAVLKEEGIKGGNKTCYDRSQTLFINRKL